MLVRVGTFNLNNLFSRFNFQGALSEIKKSGPSGSLTIRYEFTDEKDYRIRTFYGKLVKAKDAEDTTTIAERIKTIDVDVLAVQEVENIAILKEFNRDYLEGLYPYRVLIEGNDPRFIDVGLLSKLPLGAITSHQKAVHKDDASHTVFGRDLVEVEILNSTRSKKLFTIYNNHLKSHFGDDDDDGAGKIDNDDRRRKQAEKIAEIIADRQRSDAKYLLTGDMNDHIDAPPLQAMLTIEGNQLVNALSDPEETRPAKEESGGHNPTTKAWTYRHKPSGKPPIHSLFDQIWLSPALAPSLKGAYIDRRTKHGGDGGDHDPAWIELEV